MKVVKTAEAEKSECIDNISTGKKYDVLSATPLGFWIVDDTGNKEFYHKDWLSEDVPRNKYSREVKPGVFIDVYDVLRAFAVTDPCLQHLLKKALAAGVRGHKNTKEDLLDIQASANRAVEMYQEWSDENDAQGSR